MSSVVRTETEILEVVRTAVGEVLGVDPATVGATDDLIDTHSMDSLELMEIGVRVERSLGIRADVEQVREIRTPAEFVAYLVARSETPRPGGTAA
ncbi:acyl carrier protein [Streptomyces sp. CRN 30]|uniref:acyl carrier protein n=1 Tax=Streptomyces sp. CRN 30 TaxID=3075613 RepID=UPI002A7FC092|nr:acyl carrier protein [Streptomyces sp. CRN 30]